MTHQCLFNNSLIFPALLAVGTSRSKGGGEGGRLLGKVGGTEDSNLLGWLINHRDKIINQAEGKKEELAGFSHGVVG